VSPSTAHLSLAACLERYRRIGGSGALAVLATVGSTNLLARAVAAAYLAEGRPVPRLVLLAREQTAGRGRRGRSWASPAGSGIYTSILLAVADAEALAALPLQVPLALCEALEGFGVGCRIKWPNDLLVAGRKLGGVLIESIAGARAVIVGYGINGSQAEADLPTAEATSLRLATGAAPDLSQLAVDLAASVLDRLAERPAMAEIVELYAARTVHRPGDRLSCRLGDEELGGRFLGFDECGHLRLETADGERLIHSADCLDEAAVAGGRGDSEAARP
jgi:BirA family biotin operon repressor/biotin-[acetyl-CoA-carboxylase] ligase